MLLSCGNPFRNLIVSTWDHHSIKHDLVRAHLKQPVTHVRARFTDRKTLVYDQGRCGSIPAASSQYPAPVPLFLTTVQTNWSLWDFGELFCTYCDLKLCWLFSKIAKQFAFLMQYNCNNWCKLQVNTERYWGGIYFIQMECDLNPNNYVSLRRRLIQFFIVNN